MPKKELLDFVELLMEGEETDRDLLTGKMISVGYVRTAIVEEPGDFSVRGGILDVFSPMHDDPLRIEFFDRGSAPSRTLSITWQNKFGYWFWKNATVENTQTGTMTNITVEDVRVNVGMSDRALSRYALERLTGK